MSHPDSYFNRLTGNRPILNYKKSHLAPRLREIKRKEINNSSRLNLNAISFVLYRYASELGMNFHNSAVLIRCFRSFHFSFNREKNYIGSGQFAAAMP